MEGKILVGSLAVLLLCPVPLGAQQLGFMVGLGPGTGPAVQAPVGAVVPRGQILGSGPPLRWHSREHVSLRAPAVFVGPPVVKVDPGVEPRTPTPTLRTPGLPVIADGMPNVSTRRIHRPRHNPAIRYYTPALPATPHRVRPDSAPRVAAGMSRNRAIELLGRPKAQILERSSETLIFGTLTLIIENGVVAHVR